MERGYAINKKKMTKNVSYSFYDGIAVPSLKAMWLIFSLWRIHLQQKKKKKGHPRVS